MTPVILKSLEKFTLRIVLVIAHFGFQRTKLFSLRLQCCFNIRGQSKDKVLVRLCITPQ